MAKPFSVGDQVGVTSGNYAGKIGVIKSLYTDSKRAVVEIDEHTSAAIHFNRLNSEEFVEFREKYYESWLGNLPNIKTWLKDQIYELEGRFEGINHLNVFSNDEEYKKLIMLRYTLLEIEGATSTIE